jgi:hypothetical protein
MAKRLDKVLVTGPGAGKTRWWFVLLMLVVGLFALAKALAL